MAVAQVSTAPNRADYERVTKTLDLEGTPVAGLILHSAAELPSGEVQIIDLFESADALAAFAEQRPFPAFAETGLMEAAMAGPRPQAHEAFHLVVPGR